MDNPKVEFDLEKVPPVLMELLAKSVLDALRASGVKPAEYVTPDDE